MSWLFLSSVEETVDIQKYKERAKENTKRKRQREIRDRNKRNVTLKDGGNWRQNRYQRKNRDRYKKIQRKKMRQRKKEIYHLKKTDIRIY